MCLNVRFSCFRKYSLYSFHLGKISVKIKENKNKTNNTELQEHILAANFNENPSFSGPTD